MNSVDKRLRLCVGLIIFNLCIIWGNSLLPGEISGAISDFVKDCIGAIFALLGFPPGQSSGGGLLRKIAHFTEFSCLGGLFAWLFGMLRKPAFLALGCGFAAACVDETIQLFVPDRGPSIFDVGIDTAGVAAGIAVLLMIYTIRKKKH